MKVPKPILIFILMIITTSTSSCTASKSITPKIILTPTKAALVGKVRTTYSGKTQPLGGTVVRLAKVFWNSDKSDGAFVLEGGTSPSAITNQEGEFAFENIDPADYVIVVGDAEGDNEIIAQSNGKAKIFTVESDKILDIGTLEVKLRPGQ
jgi:hypothetical protein